MARSILSTQFNNVAGVVTGQHTQLCALCCRQALRQRVVQPHLVRDASSGVPFLEQVRRKIWGTDNPPGLPDPYGGPGYFEQKLRQMREGREASAPGPGSSPPEPGNLESEQAPSVRHPLAMDDMVLPRSVPENEPEEEDPSYVPAETWDGLEHVGLSGHWREMPSKPEESFRPFLDTFEKAVSGEEFLSALHQALVEVLILRDSSFHQLSGLGHVTYTPEDLASISGASIELDQTGSQIILRHSDAAKRSVMEALRSCHENLSTTALISETAEAEVQSSEASRDLSAAHDGNLLYLKTQETSPAAREVEEGQTGAFMDEEGEASDQYGRSHMGNMGEPFPQKRIPYTVTSLGFLRLPLEPIELRFSVFKRLSQLTGHRIPDPLLTSRTLMPIYKYLSRKGTSKAKKLADHLLAKKDLVGLPNVHIMSRRETPVHRDKRVGRWKMIESELQSKGLPVLSKAEV